MNEKHINIILSNVSQRSHCLVLNISAPFFYGCFILADIFFLARVNPMWMHFIVASLQNAMLWICQYTLTLQLLGLCCCWRFCWCRHMPANIWVGNSTKDGLCKFFIVLWFTEIFLNVVLMIWAPLGRKKQNGKTKERGGERKKERMAEEKIQARWLMLLLQVLSIQLPFVPLFFGAGQKEKAEREQEWKPETKENADEHREKPFFADHYFL